MSVLLILIPVSLALAAGFVMVCLSSIKSGQFDDLESPRWRVLFDGNSSAVQPSVATVTAEAKLKATRLASNSIGNFFDSATDNPKKDAG